MCCIKVNLETKNKGPRVFGVHFVDDWNYL